MLTSALTPLTVASTSEFSGASSSGSLRDTFRTEDAEVAAVAAFFSRVESFESLGSFSWTAVGVS